MNAADVLCYTYEADYHCTPCAIKRFGEQPGSPVLHPWIADDSIDSEGNTPAPVFGDSVWWNTDSAWEKVNRGEVADEEPQSLECADCHGVIASVGYVQHLTGDKPAEWVPDFQPLIMYLVRNPEKQDFPWEYMGTDERGTFSYREREHGNRIKLTATGRLACVHLLAGTRRCSITESDTLTYL